LLDIAAGAGLSNLIVVLRNRVAGNAREASAASESRPNNPNGVATVAGRASLVSGEGCLETRPQIVTVLVGIAVHMEIEVVIDLDGHENGLFVYPAALS
jgi:hypothetical protein